MQYYSRETHDLYVGKMPPKDKKPSSQNNDLPSNDDIVFYDIDDPNNPYLAKPLLSGDDGTVNTDQDGGGSSDGTTDTPETIDLDPTDIYKVSGDGMNYSIPDMFSDGDLYIDFTELELRTLRQIQEYNKRKREFIRQTTPGSGSITGNQDELLAEFLKVNDFEEQRRKVNQDLERRYNEVGGNANPALKNAIHDAHLGQSDISPYNIVNTSVYTDGIELPRNSALTANRRIDDSFDARPVDSKNFYRVAPTMSGENTTTIGEVTFTENEQAKIGRAHV